MTSASPLRNNMRLARLSAPARQKRHASIEGRTTNGHEWATNIFFHREKGEEGRGECVDTLQWASVKSREEGGEGRGECVDTLQWASVKSREKGEEGRR